MCVISTPLCLSVLFQEKTWLIKRGLGGRGGGYNKVRQSNVQRMQHFWITVYVYLDFSRLTFFAFFSIFPQLLLLRDHSKWRAKQKQRWGGIMLIWTFILKVKFLALSRWSLNMYIYILRLQQKIKICYKFT